MDLGPGRERRVIVSVLTAALDAAEPYHAVRDHLKRSGNVLKVGTSRFDLRRFGRVRVLGAGKAAAPMAAAAEFVLGKFLTDGFVVTKCGYGKHLKTVTVVEAGHPVPDEAGLSAARKVLDVAHDSRADDLILVLLSGGASALLPAPSGNLTLAEKQAVTHLLLRSGATINDLNAVRKHLSAIKGGRLAAAIYPARIISLILSDVVGDPLDVIASGPTVADPTTFEDAIAVLKRYNLWERVPAAVREHLVVGARRPEAETPKVAHPAVFRSSAVIVGSVSQSVQAAAAAAKKRGLRPLILTSRLEGEAREAGRFFAAMAKEIAASGVPVRRPCCLVAGGETTVTVRGGGKGGRNQEFALGAVEGIAGLQNCFVVGFGTDGTDGPTDAAGAVASGDTLVRARDAGLSPGAHLKDNDAYRFFDALGDLIRTGPTRTNVNDLYLLFLF